MRLALLVTLIAMLAITVLSFSVFGETDALEDNALTPVNGVFTVENADQLIWLFENSGSTSVPTDATIKLANDIDVDGKLPVFKRVFTGIFDGNGKTISGLNNPLFKQFNGTAKNLTLRGAIDATTGTTSEIAAKTGSFAPNSTSATLTNVVSYVDMTVSGGGFNLGGLVGLAKGKNQFTDCEYRGEITVEWTTSTCTVGGIVGYSVPDGNKVSIEGCVFGGKMTVSGGVAGKKLPVGGILGQASAGNVVIKECSSFGTITSAITDGTDYAGGVIGVNDSVQISLEYCSNKSTVTAVNSAGGIYGGITVASKAMNCTNFGEITAATAGELCGNGKGVNFSCFSSYDFSKANNKLCGTDFTSNSSYASDAVSFEKTFTLGSFEYDVYNVCTVEKESGLVIQTLNTTKPFEAFVSTREDGDKQAIRFVILTNCAFPSSSMTVSIQFKDLGGKVIKSYTGVLGGASNDFTLYGAVAAGGENYFAKDGCALFGCVITDVPIGAWETAELTVVDTANGTVYLEPVKIEGYTERMTMAVLPDYSGLGTVSNVTYNCGPGLASDQNGYTNEDSYMVVISDTSKEKFEAYVNGLDKAGFSFVSKTTADGDDYYTYSRYGKLLYLYYTHRVNEIRIIADNSSDVLSKLSYDYEPKAGEKAEFYQYSINYTLNDQKGFDPVDYTESGGMNCGMLYVIKTADNKVMIVDGGYTSQLSALAKKHFVNFLHEITGTPAKEKVKVATWFITHAHGDHTSGARDIISGYSQQLELESVIFNFPSYQVISEEYDGNTFTLKETITRLYPDVLYHKLHTGEQFSMGGVDMEVLYTHEDSVGANGVTRIVNDFNSTSTVLRLTIDGKTFTILGDINTHAQDTIVAMHSAEYMKSDLMQAAHHGYNHIGQVYDMISAEIVVFPQSMRIAKGDCVHQYKAATGDHAKETYFAHARTYKFTVEDGVIKATGIKRYDQK